MFMYTGRFEHTKNACPCFRARAKVEKIGLEENRGQHKHYLVTSLFAPLVFVEVILILLHEVNQSVYF